MMTPWTLRRSHLTAWPVAEVFAAGLVVAGIAVVFSKSPEVHRAGLGLFYLAVLAVIVLCDARTHRAPNRLVYPSVGLAIVASLALGGADAAEALLGGLGAFVALLAVEIAGRGAMGAGDVKVGALCGITVGLHGVIPMLLVTFILGAAVAAPLLILRLRRRADSIAFTPFLAAATLFSIAYYDLYLWG